MTPLGAPGNERPPPEGPSSPRVTVGPSPGPPSSGVIAIVITVQIPSFLNLRLVTSLTVARGRCAKTLRRGRSLSLTKA